MAKLITVIGATGAQGGPISRVLLQNGFKVRAVTRNPDSEKAKALKDAGAEVVAGNMDDNESVKAAVRDAYGVFYVTSYWELFAKDFKSASDRETQQGKRVADACKAAGVQHVVFSGLESVKETFGKPCPHVDSKRIVEKYLDEIGVPNTSVRYPFYFENFISFYPRVKKEDGSCTFTLPMDGPMVGIAVADGAQIVLTVFQNREEYLGKILGICSERKTFAEYAAVISCVTGKTYDYVQISLEQYRNQSDNPAVESLATMYEYASYGNPPYSEELTRKIYPGVLSFEKWVKQNQDKF